MTGPRSQSDNDMFVSRYAQHIVRIVLRVRLLRYDRMNQIHEICEMMPDISADLIRDICMYERFRTWEKGQITAKSVVLELKGLGFERLRTLVGESGFKTDDKVIRAFIDRESAQGFIGELGDDED